jgi:MFS family permease
VKLFEAISEDDSYPRPAYASYVIAVLLLANVCCYMARMVLLLLVQPINHALQISDTQMSLLQGAAFSIFFVVAGLPVGWLTDRSGRRNILVASVVTWSVMAIFCGIASSYNQLFLARVGVGIGEAALTPAAFSLIADYFPPRRRGRAMAVYYMGALFGTGIATTFGGVLLGSLERGLQLPFLGAMAPWQVLFVLSGTPGFLIAALLFTVREPIRHDAIVVRISSEIAVRKTGILRFLMSNWRAFLPVYLALGLIQFCAFALTAWIIPLLVRRDHMTTPEAGATYGILVVVIGVFAALFGGVIGDVLGGQSKIGGRFRAVLYAYVIFLPGIVITTLATTPVIADIGLVIEIFGVCVASSMMYTVLQDIVPNQYRGQAVAILSMLVTLGSATMAPTAVALYTDRLFRDPDMVGYSILLTVIPAAIIGIVLNFAGLKAYSRAGAELRNAAAVTVTPLETAPVVSAIRAVRA